MRSCPPSTPAYLLSPSPQTKGQMPYPAYHSLFPVLQRPKGWSGHKTRPQEGFGKCRLHLLSRRGVGGVSACTKGRQATELDGIWPGMAIAWEKRSKPSILGRIPSTNTGISGPSVLTHPLWSTRQTWQTVEPPTH